MQMLKIADAAELAEAVASAVAQGTGLEVIGKGTRREFGRPVAAETALDLSAMAGITMYEPDELVMTAKPATPLADIVAAMNEAGQILAFDPPLCRQGQNTGQIEGTIGGVMATNQSGPRRLVAGAARDYLLGFKAISGRGEAFQSGSRVMKNVTGYDLSKLMAGSFGTLAVMHEMTFKTMPKPETSATILYACQDFAAAGALIRTAYASPHEATMAAIIPADVAVFSKVQSLAEFIQKGVIAVIRVEGFEKSVLARSQALSAIGVDLEGVSPGHVLAASGQAADSDDIHAEIREVSLLPRQNNRVIFKISCPPDRGAELLEKLIARPNCRAFADWAGGLIWVSHPAGGDGGTKVIRELVAETGGHVTLNEAPHEMRLNIPVFPPQSEALMALTKRVKNSFDPEGILNPGRMYEGV